MRRGFSLINVIIILGLIYLAYFGYVKYLDNKVKQVLLTPAISHNAPGKQGLAATTTPVKQPVKTNPISTAESTVVPEKIIPPTPVKGYYLNQTYAYEISFPPAWPIRVRSADNISFGTVPPEDGQGAITIEVTKESTSNELNQAKAEAAKYRGLVSLTETPFTLAGVAGTKIILNNLMASSKNIFILLTKNSLNYLIKYSEESPEFTKQAEQALTTFKFTK